MARSESDPDGPMPEGCAILIGSPLLILWVGLIWRLVLWIKPD